MMLVAGERATTSKPSANVAEATASPATSGGIAILMYALVLLMLAVGLFSGRLHPSAGIGSGVHTRQTCLAEAMSDTGLSRSQTGVNGARVDVAQDDFDSCMGTST